jgi:hypothetical protein
MHLMCSIYVSMHECVSMFVRVQCNRSGDLALGGDDGTLMVVRVIEDRKYTAQDFNYVVDRREDYELEVGESWAATTLGDIRALEWSEKEESSLARVRSGDPAISNHTNANYFLVAGDAEGAVAVFSWRTGEEQGAGVGRWVLHWTFPHAAEVTSLTSIIDHNYTTVYGAQVCITYADGCVRVMNPSREAGEGDVVYDETHADLEGLGYSQWASSGKEVLVCTYEGHLKFLSVESKEVLAEIRADVVYNEDRGDELSGLRQRKVVAMDWFNAANDVLQPKTFCLAFGFDDGSVVMMVTLSANHKVSGRNEVGWWFIGECI